jgi:hypothetical protein
MGGDPERIPTWAWLFACAASLLVGVVLGWGTGILECVIL